MAIDSIIHEAETKADTALERVRQSVVLRIQPATLTGIHGQSLRDGIDRTIQSGMQNVATQFTPDIQSAWQAGIKRAEAGETSYSTLTPDTATFEETVRRAVTRLSSSMQEDIGNVLIKASVDPQYTKERAIDVIGASEGEGLFAGYANRLSGTVTYALQTVESYAFNTRSRELVKVRAQMTSQSKAREMIAKGVKPLTMKVWLHSHGGNPPRQNHVDFDGCGVPVDMKFKLRGRDGTIYRCEGPHDMALPPAESVNCHCSTFTVTIDVTDSEQTDIYDRATATGGYVDKRWSE